MSSISVVIITYNEEKNIDRCLQSLKGIADEIVVVDSLSTDNTESICMQYGVRFISQAFLGYIEQKNFALDQASHDHVLSLDADESLSELLLESIADEKQKGFPVDGYTMNRCSSFCGKWIRHGAWYPDRKLRLVNKKKGRWGGINPHDKLELKEGSSIQQLKGEIFHYSYYSLEEVVTQNNKFTSIQAKAMFAQGRRANVLNLIFNPLLAFINGFILKAGFLDGADGFFIASSVAYQTMVKYAKLLHLQREQGS